MSDLTEPLEPYEQAILRSIQCLALLSLLSCLCTFVESAADRSPKLVTRIQYWMQLPLASMSLALFLSRIPAPRQYPGGHGSEATCQVQGFLYQVGLMGGMGWDLSLSLSYLLMIQQKWQEEDLQRLEPYLHAILWPLAVLPAAWAGIQGGYALIFDNCYIDKNSPTVWLQQATSLLALSHFLGSVYVISRVYRFALDHAAHTSSRIVARKGLLYASSILVLQIPHLVTKLVRLAGGRNDVLYAATSCTIPLAGFLNMLVFLMYRSEMYTRYGRLVHCLLCRQCWPNDAEASDDDYDPRLWVLNHRDLFASSQEEEEPKKFPSLESIPEEQ